jgi:cytosine/adenosine deaminase-related metal-dependent hydrolase
MFDTSGPYTAGDHRACALAAAAEMLLTGTTAVVDHLWTTTPDPACVEAALAAYADIGIRAAVAPLVGDTDATDDLAAAMGLELGSASMRNRATPLPTAEVCALLAELMGRWHGACDGRLRVLAGPSGVQWCSNELLVGLAEVARRHGTGIQLHLLETGLQEAACRRRFGTSAVRALGELGVLGPDVSLAHAVWLDGEDIEAIADAGAVVVHNPAANLRLGSGRAPVPELMAAGATIALGSDGAASSDNHVMWDQMKLAALIHNDGADRWLGGAGALSMATAGGAAVLGEPGLGALAAGAPADVVLLDRVGDGLAGAQCVEGALALSETGRGVRHVVVAGEVVVLDGALVTVDVDEVRAGLLEQARRRGASPSPQARAAMARVEALRRMVAGPAVAP